MIGIHLAQHTESRPKFRVWNLYLAKPRLGLDPYSTSSLICQKPLLWEMQAYQTWICFCFSFFPD